MDVMLRRAGKTVIHCADEIELPALHIARLARADVFHRLLRICLHDAGLMLRG